MNSMTLDANLMLTPTDEIISAAPTQEAENTAEPETTETIGKTDDNNGDGDTINPFVVTVVGLAIVFVGLVLLIGIVKLIGTICNAAFGGKKKQNKAVLLPAGKDDKKLAASALTDAQRGELIAVISAAIAENMGKPVSGIRIRSIKKVG